MDTKALIQAEIDRLSEEDLNELYRLVKGFTRSKDPSRKLPLLSRLKQIKIDAPKDFAANLDRYESGERCAE